MDVGSYRCSDGKTYSVVRHFMGGWGGGSWSLAGFCNTRTLSMSEYEARVLNARDSHPDIARCQDEDTMAIRACFAEFKSLNGERGTRLHPIVHGRQESSKFGYSSNQIPSYSSRNERTSGGVR